MNAEKIFKPFCVFYSAREVNTWRKSSKISKKSTLQIMWKCYKPRSEFQAMERSCLMIFDFWFVLFSSMRLLPMRNLIPDVLWWDCWMSGVIGIRTPFWRVMLHYDYYQNQNSSLFFLLTVLLIQWRLEREVGGQAERKHSSDNVT